MNFDNPQIMIAIYCLASAIAGYLIRHFGLAIPGLPAPRDKDCPPCPRCKCKTEGRDARPSDRARYPDDSVLGPVLDDLRALNDYKRETAALPKVQTAQERIGDVTSTVKAIGELDKAIKS